MKTTTIASKMGTALVVLILAAAGCKKDNGAIITADDAADAVAYALQDSSGGFAGQITDAASYANSEGVNKTEAVQSITCGVEKDTSFTKTYAGSYTANYTHDWRFILNCDGIDPSSLDFMGSYIGSFASTRMQSENNGTRNLTLTGLGNNSNYYIVNGNFTRTGSHTSSLRNKNVFTTNIITSMVNVKIDKASYKIVGGTSNITVACANSNGASYTFTGSIIFIADQMATLTLNDNVYTIKLY